MSERPYLDPEEACQADAAATLVELQRTVAELRVLFAEKKQLIQKLEDDDFLTDVEDIEWRLKHRRDLTSDLHRIESGLQSILRVP